ncbi:MAG: SRPBCC domain-containing protein [Mycobacteriaceae bacterium]
MDLQNTFVVEAPIAEVWKAFLEPDRVAPCFPGATLKESDETSFTGTVKVKLGPVAMLYKGTGTYVETDEAARRTVIKANGKDSRGNGQANATVTMTLSEASDTTTTVVVDTDLSITGKPAQLGRGIITEVAGKIIGQFADCLGQRLGADADAGGSDAAPEAATEPVVPAGPESGGALTGSAPQPTATPEEVPAAPTPKAVPRPKPAYPPTPDAIDLLDSGGSAVAKRVAPVAVGALLGGLVVWLLTRRR